MTDEVYINIFCSVHFGSQADTIKYRLIRWHHQMSTSWVTFELGDIWHQENHSYIPTLQFLFSRKKWALPMTRTAFLSLLVLKKNFLWKGQIQWTTNRKLFGSIHSLFWLLYRTQNAGRAAFLKSSGFFNFPVRVIFSLWFTWGVTPVKNHHLFFASLTARRWLFCTRSQSCWKKHFYIASSYMTIV